MIIPFTFSANPQDLPLIEKHQKRLGQHSHLLSECARGFLAPMDSRYRPDSRDLRERNVCRFVVATNDGSIMVMSARMHVEQQHIKQVIKMPGLYTLSFDKVCTFENPVSGFFQVTKDLVDIKVVNSVKDSRE